PKHLGMVGFFPPLVKKFRAAGQKLTVIEQQAAFVEKADNFEVTLDATRLADCDQVLCTASTLLNDSLPSILAHCAEDCFISLIGPTAGCLPDTLFALGIDEIGASRVVAIDTLIERMQNAEPWGDAVEKYTISAAAYPGWRALLT
ncbi:MAG: hypothetical protein KDJ38_17065, partial [Gammaproteobacteria bacterium]|nr:hypothetical protein [Gammaproteobacteria bacterium]